MDQNNKFIILPGEFIGILGGGQLARMFCFAAQSMGYSVVVFDPDKNSSAGSIANIHICASYNDKIALNKLSKLCSSISIEFENVPIETINILSLNAFISPSKDCIYVIQNRILEKQFLESSGILVAPYIPIKSYESLSEIVNDKLFYKMLPAILKTSRFGYNGKMQVDIINISEMLDAYIFLGEVECILEKKINIKYEISVLIARDINGKSVIYNVTQNIHHDKLLLYSITPAISIKYEIIKKIKNIALSIVKKLNYIGVLCIEFFLSEDEKIIVNEMAPRPHNSAHYTINACVTSQFEQQVRAMTGMTVGSNRQHSCSIMINILGDSWFVKDKLNNSIKNKINEPMWKKILEIPEAHLHLYGKKDVYLGRKMGHINCIASTFRKTLLSAKKCANFLYMNLNI